MPASSPAPGRPLILHVEDDRAQLDTLKNIFEGSGCAVLQASSAEEALQLCRDAPVSLVIADHMLGGGKTGTELAAQIKTLKPTLPIVLHSGSPPPEMHHLDGYIHKGEPTVTLVAFVHDLVHRFWQ